MVGEEIGRVSQVRLHLTLALQQLVGPEHPEGCLQWLDPAVAPRTLEGMQEGVVQGRVVAGWRVEESRRAISNSPNSSYHR